ncbi:hypothetical protein Tco_0366962 [Tanacetum coccineum]
MSSRVSNRTVNTTEPLRNQKSFLKSKDLACPTCKKCIYSANRDECILKYLSQVNSRASVQKKQAQSHKTTKRYIPVEKKSDSKNYGRQILIGQRFSPNKSSNGVIWKTRLLDRGPTWKPRVESLLKLVLSGFPLESSSMASEPISSKGSSNEVLPKLNLPDHRYKRRCCSLIPAESNSLPHAHTQATKTYYKHQDSRIKKAQELNTKTSANSDIQDLPKSYQDYQDNDCQGRLLASFQDDA